MREFLRSPSPGGPSLHPTAHAAAGAWLLFCASCAGAAAQTQPQGPSLWPYAGDATQIFDDRIELTAVGYGADLDRRAARRAAAARPDADCRRSSPRARAVGQRDHRRRRERPDHRVPHHRAAAGVRPPLPDFVLQADVGAGRGDPQVVRASARQRDVHRLRRGSSRAPTGSRAASSTSIFAPDNPDEVIAIKERRHGGATTRAETLPAARRGPRKDLREGSIGASKRAEAPPWRSTSRARKRST